MKQMDHEIEIEAFEAVADGGTRRVSWHVAQGERWLPAANYPGARVELEDRRPGVVWRRRVTLSLPTGARLMRIESQPGSSVQRDPLAYLWKAARSAQQKQQRSYFSVGPQGRLVRAPREP
jgi:hypothetical protein